MASKPRSKTRFRRNPRRQTGGAKGYVTGNYDFVLIVNARDMSHFETFSRKQLMDNANLKHFYTHMVMDKVKVGYGVAV